MEIAMVSLGKMGANMVTRLLSGGHRVIAYDINTEAIDLDVPAPVITLALQARFVSRQGESYAAKLLAAMPNQFGGHAVKTE